MSEKLFTFNASSFTLDSKVESFLKSRGAITLDFGSSAYINSDLMPLILANMIEKLSETTNDDLVIQLRAEIAHAGARLQKMAEDEAQQLKSASAEITSLKEKLAEADKVIESLKAENTRIQIAQKNVPQQVFDRTQYEKILRDFQDLKAQNADVITSLKVLEDENEELREELDVLRSQAKASQAPKLG